MYYFRSVLAASAAAYTHSVVLAQNIVAALFALLPRLLVKDVLTSGSEWPAIGETHMNCKLMNAKKHVTRTTAFFNKDWYGYEYIKI